jgi:hypothetical protein
MKLLQQLQYLVLKADRIFGREGAPSDYALITINGCTYTVGDYFRLKREST